MTNHGGSRPGAGRKPAPPGTTKVTLSVKIDPQIREYLRQCDNATATIETALKRSAAFKRWKAT